MARTVIGLVKQGGAIKSEDIEDDDTAADASNNMYFVNNGKTRLVIANGSGGSLDVVFNAPQKYGLIDATLTVSTDAAKTSVVGPFDQGTFNQNDGTVEVDIATDTSLTLIAISD